VGVDTDARDNADDAVALVNLFGFVLLAPWVVGCMFCSGLSSLVMMIFS
jgi:hypothetical protein